MPSEVKGRARRIRAAKPRFALRTIRNGSVRINGVTFRPDARHFAYDGRLDGMRYAFGLYYVGPEWQPQFVHCWGTEQAYRCQNEEEFKRLFHEDPQIVDGAFVWETWSKVVSDGGR